MSTLITPTPVKDAMLDIVSKVPFIDDDKFVQILDEHPIFCGVYFTAAAAAGIAAGVAMDVWLITAFFSLF